MAGLLAPGALAPDWAVEGSQILVVAILPIGFFAVGVTLAGAPAGAIGRLSPGVSRAVATAIGLKLLLLPAILLGLSEAVVEVPAPYLTQAAMASGINTILIANQYGLDRELAAAAIVWTTAIVVAAGVVGGMLA